ALSIGFECLALLQLTIGIRRRYVMALEEHRGELLPAPQVAADSQRSQSIAVIALPARDEMPALRLSALDEILARHLERRLDGLGATGNEIDVREPRGSMLDQVIRKPLGHIRREE